MWAHQHFSNKMQKRLGLVKCTWKLENFTHTHTHTLSVGVYCISIIQAVCERVFGWMLFNPYLVCGNINTAAKVVPHSMFANSNIPSLYLVVSLHSFSIHFHYCTAISRRECSHSYPRSLTAHNDAYNFPMHASANESESEQTSSMNLSIFRALSLFVCRLICINHMLLGVMVVMKCAETSLIHCSKQYTHTPHTHYVPFA